MSAMLTGNDQHHPAFYPAFMPHGLTPENKDFEAMQPSATVDLQQHTPAPMRGHILSIYRFVDSRLLSADLSPAMIARHLGMSRAKLYRLAKPLGGVQRFVRERRLQYAAALIAEDAPAAQSISCLAYDLGFGSENTFRRNFKEAFGRTPTEARSVARRHLGAV